MAAHTTDETLERTLFKASDKLRKSLAGLEYSL